jgi:hypothetical protein
MRWSRLLLLLAGVGLCVAAGAALLGSCGAADATSEAGAGNTTLPSSIASPSSSPPVQPPAWLLEAATQEAKDCGDPHPELAEWVTSRKHEAVRVLSGDEMFDNDFAVFVVVLKGHFTDTKSFAPPGAPDPTGTWLFAVYDARTHGGVGFGLGDKSYLLEQLGPVHGFSL